MFSLCTKEAKLLVKVIKPQIQHIILRLSGTVSLTVEGRQQSLVFFFLEENGKSVSRKTPQAPRPSFDDPHVVGFGPSYSPSTAIKWAERTHPPSFYINHILDIFNWRKGIMVRAQDDTMEPASIPSALRDVFVNIVNLDHNNRAPEHSPPKEMALSLTQANYMHIHCDSMYPYGWRPRPKHLMFTNDETEMAYAKLSIQNYKSLIFDAHRITVDHLSSLNCEHFHCNAYFTGPEIRRFLKLWMAGSATRLKHLKTNISSRIPFTMNGIKSIEREETLRRSYRRLDRWTNSVEEIIRGGHDIVRKSDKTYATVHVARNTFQFIVWQSGPFSTSMPVID